MAQTNALESPLETVTGAFSPEAAEAFSILANETRLAVLIALWDEMEPFAEHPTDYNVGFDVSFSELRRRVGVSDPGQFHYHMDKLVGRFVRKTDEGFELTPEGKKVVQTIIATVGFEHQSTAWTEIDAPCPLCDAPTTVTYRDYRLYQRCTDCEGLFSLDASHPDRMIIAWKSNPAILNHGSADAVFRACQREAAHHYALRYDGVCHQCSGPVEHSLHICEAHDSQDGETCPTCDRRFEVGARFVCTVCKSANICPVSKAVMVPHHPEIEEFLVDRGVVPAFPYLTEIPGLEIEEAVVSSDPPEVRMTLTAEGDQLKLLVDEEVNVVEVSS